MLPLSELTIDLAALQTNYRLLREKAAPAATGACVKADGYGVGAVPVARALYDSGCRVFFAGHFARALKLRSALRDCIIVPLHGVAEDEYAEARAQDITPMLNSLGAIEDWAKFARRQGKKLPAFIHLDTGMNRLGLPPDEQQKLIADPSVLEGIEIKAWISHLACSEEFNNPITTEQRDRFNTLLKQLPKAKASLCNSSGIFWGNDYLFDLARPGAALYGINPTPEKPNPMRGVVELKAPILQTRHVDAMSTVGYGATHRTTRKSRIATLALGYADGYLRSLSSRGKVKIGDFLAPVVARVSMDLITVDVSDVPEKATPVGANAIVIGAHRPVDAVASEGGTNAYEILTSIGSRVQRHYAPLANKYGAD